MKKKYIFRYFLSFLFLLNYIYSTNKINDVFLGNLQKKIIEIDGKNTDYNLSIYAEAYILLGNSEIPLKLLNELKSDYYKYLLLNSLIEKIPIDSQMANELKKKFRMIKDFSLKSDLNFDLSLKMEVNNKKKIELYFNKIKISDEFPLVLNLLDQVIENFSRIKFKDEVRSQLKDYENSLRFNEIMIEYYLKILSIYKELNFNHEYKELLAKIDYNLSKLKNIRIKILDLIKLANVLCEMGETDLCREYINKAYSTYKIFRTFSEQNKIISEIFFIPLNKLTKKLILKKFINNGKLIKTILEQISNNKNLEVYHYKYLIEYLIETGDIKDAYDLSDTFDKYSKKGRIFFDIYYSKLIGFLINTEYPVNNILMLIDNISDNSKKMELLVNYAKLLKNQSDLKKQYYKILLKLDSIRKKIEFEKDFYYSKFSDILIRRNFIELALKIINRFDSEDEKSNLILKLGIHYLSINDQSNINRILNNNYLLKSDKSIIISNIASKLMFEGKLVESIKLFDTAVDLTLTSDISRLDIILERYLLSRYKIKSDLGKLN